LLRLLAANHPFVDGNKRTALMSVRVFYALNGLEFDYDRRIKEILKELATDETAADAETVVSYFETHTEPLPPEYQATIALWLERIEANDHQPSSVTPDRIATENDDPNGYDDSHSTEE
jgi:death-on-curing protein